MTELHDIRPLMMKSISENFRVKGKISVIKTQIPEPLKSIKQPHRLAQVNRAFRGEIEGLGQHKRTFGVSDTHTDTSPV
jgi:hypothetical protein